MTKCRSSFRVVSASGRATNYTEMTARGRTSTSDNVLRKCRRWFAFRVQKDKGKKIRVIWCRRGYETVVQDDTTRSRVAAHSGYWEVQVRVAEQSRVEQSAGWAGKRSPSAASRLFRPSVVIAKALMVGDLGIIPSTSHLEDLQYAGVLLRTIQQCAWWDQGFHLLHFRFLETCPGIMETRHGFSLRIGDGAFWTVIMYECGVKRFLVKRGKHVISQQYRG